MQCKISTACGSKKGILFLLQYYEQLLGFDFEQDANDPERYTALFKKEDNSSHFKNNSLFNLAKIVIAIWIWSVLGFLFVFCFFPYMVFVLCIVTCIIYLRPT